MIYKVKGDSNVEENHLESLINMQVQIFTSKSHSYVTFPRHIQYIYTFI